MDVPYTFTLRKIVVLFCSFPIFLLGMVYIFLTLFTFAPSSSDENFSSNSTSPIKRAAYSSPPFHNLELEDSFTESDTSLLSCSPSTPRGNSKSPVPNVSGSSVCPPTPLPTPNWVQRTKGRRWGRIARKNSLAATKTLLEINDGFNVCFVS